LSKNATINDKISCRISKASAAFDRLMMNLWSKHEVSLKTKLSVYKAVILSVLLFSCETWMPYPWHIQKLESFHLHCLHHICGIRWQDMIPNTRHQGAPQKHFKDSLKSNLKKCHTELQQLEILASDRQKWHELCRSGLQDFEAERISELNQKWEQHTAKITLQASKHICLHCDRFCASRAGLLAHIRFKHCH
uniref:C2H2-type domain-containing protein n=1 Tax=Latimeria chalumnae TaxID=7897 RepID=H3B0J2_LATCH